MKKFHLVDSVRNVIKPLATLLVFGLLLYLTVRSDSSFRSIPWMPKSFVVFVQKNLDWRNFWGFLPAGFFLGFVYFRSIFPLNWDRFRIIVLILLIPVAKEIMQIPLPSRHCNMVGMLTGILGMALGVSIACSVRQVIHVIRARIYKSKAQPSPADAAVNANERVDVEC